MNVCLGMYVCTMYIMVCAIDHGLGRKIMEDLKLDLAKSELIVFRNWSQDRI